jgi:hypothetical protein
LKLTVLDGLVVVLLALVAFLPLDSVPGTSKVTAVVYTIDDKQHFVPSPVAAALDKLNRQGITATVDEVDTTNPGGSVPAQYKVSRPAAQAAGLPALVVLASDRVVRTVSKPTTEEQTLEAAK